MYKIFPAPVEFSAEQLALDPILRYFHYGHLPPVLQAVSREFCGLATFIIHTVPRNAERTVALRKLLEAKDAAVRANVPVQASPPLDEPKIIGDDQSETPVPFK